MMESLRPVVLVNGLQHGHAFCEGLRALDIDAYVIGEASDGSMGLRDLHGDFFALYGLKRKFVCLIRPDGHVGFIGPADPRPLRKYLELLCDPIQVSEIFAEQA